jgi:transglycosylase-like protein with SLT domain
LSVTAFIGIVSKTRAHILRLTSARLHDLVASDWSARAVLRFWRLRNRARTALTVVRNPQRALSVNFVGHGLVLALGFVLVVPTVSGRAAPTRTVAAEYSGYVLWTSSVPARNAPAMREVAKASALEERPAPAVVSQAPVIARRVTPRPAQSPVGTFTPPPGSGGDGLAAIYAVFGNSPGLSWALRVANCESHYNPLAINRSSGASGLFQFMPSTWNANFPGQNIWDPYAQARGALVFYNAGRQSAWTCK